MEKNIPKRRFKEFINSGEWEEKKLGEVASYRNGKAHEKMQQSNGRYELINLNSISIDGGLKHSGKFVNQANNTLLKDDLVMVLSDVGHGNLLGRVALIPENNKFVLNQRVALLRIEDQTIPKFLYTNINANQIYFKRNGAGMSQLNLSRKSVENFPLFIPSLQEQEKIGNFFEKLDRLIDLNREKLEKLKNIKSAYLSEMFPKEGELYPKRRFARFTKPWEEKKFEDEVKFYNGLTYSPKNISTMGTLVLRSSNVKNGSIVVNDKIYVESDIVNSLNVKKGDIIVVVRNGSRSLIGKHAQIKENMNNTVIGAFMTGIRSNQNNFINVLLDTKQFKNEVDKNLGATINQITNYMFSEMVFKFPSLPEQEKIGNFFKKLDEKIILQEKKIEKLENMKKAYLSEMFV